MIARMDESTLHAQIMNAKHGSARIYVNVLIHHVVVFSDNPDNP